MDPRIEKIIDRLLDDCLADRVASDDKVWIYNYPELSEKDLLTITQNFLEFKYAKMTRTSISDKGFLQSLPYPEKKSESNN